MQPMVEESRDTPLVSVAVCFPRGCSSDPAGLEGFVRHTAELMRRGAGRYDREQLDETIDSLGASINASLHRDYVGFYATCLARNLDAMVDMLATIFAEPRMDELQHAKLLRETEYALDELRDDDASLASRFAHYMCCPGHPYARTALGTRASLAKIELEDVRAARHWVTSGREARIGFAGAISAADATRYAEILRSALPDGEPPARPRWPETEPAPARAVIVDKPDRKQTQLCLSHVAPLYGTDSFAALLLAETAFGGTFSSRMTQELRVKRGYSYGASMSMLRGALPYWIRLSLAPALDVTRDALEVLLTMYRDICHTGLPQDELDFARDHLIGALAFARSTAFRRLHRRMERAMFGLPDRSPEDIRALLESFNKSDVDDAIRRYWHPDRLCTVMVGTADELRPRLSDLELAPIEVVDHQSY